MRLQQQAIICGVKIKWSNGVSIRKGSHTSSVCCNLSFSFQWLGSRSGCTWFPLPLMGSLCSSTQPVANGTEDKKGHQVLWHKLHFSVILVSAGQALSFCSFSAFCDHVSFDLQFSDLSVQESYRDYTVWGFLEKRYLCFQFSLLLPIHLT